MDFQLVRAKMAYSFRGQYEAKVDSKSRLALPSGLRQSLPEQVQLVVTNSIFRGKKCLDVYTWDEWVSLEEKIAKLPSLNANVQAFQRFYLSAGHVLQMDNQNRILVPKTLKLYANIKDKVQLVGMGKKFEIWDSKSWSSLSSDIAASFDEILENVALLEEGEN